MYRVYRIANRVNGKSYIGITSRSVNERWLEHISLFNCSDRFSRLYLAMRKYDLDNFDVEELATSSCEDAVRNLETKFIHRYDSYENGYNCNYGGCGHLYLSTELRKKIGDTQKGKIIPLESRKKMSQAKLGDKRCAKHLGEYVNKGKENPSSKRFLIRFPDGHVEVIWGLRQFCRDYGMNYFKFTNKGGTCGFTILKRFRDYPDKGSTPQAIGGGSGAHLDASQGEDIVRSSQQCGAVHKRTGII